MMFKLGIDKLEANSALFEGKRVGLLTNCTGVDSSLESTIDLLCEHFNLVKLFAPEHGVRGNLQAGVVLSDYVDEKTGLPVISLYGSSKCPKKEATEDIDMVAFDMQDVGSRFYTYLYSMAYMMEACAEYNKKFVVFDRPAPMNALGVEGNMLELSCSSFIGRYPIPQRYGVTIGECARLFNSEYGIGCDLSIITMDGYERSMFFEDTGAKWIVPSPNIPTVDTCFTFNCSCLFEGTNVSEGRGTTKPFSFIGSPWLNGDKLAEALKCLSLPGVSFRPHYFTPLKYHHKYSKYAGELCGGIEIHINDRTLFRPVQTGLTILYTIKELFNEDFRFNQIYMENGKHIIDCITGGNYVRENTRSLNDILTGYEAECKEFENVKAKYHLYS